MSDTNGPILTFPPTTLPCPAWCGLPAGHGFDSQEPADPSLVYRSHERDIVRTPTGRGPDSAVVELSSMEAARDEQVVQAFPVVIAVFGYCEGDDLTGPQARQLAAALLNAADQWDEITGATA